MRLRYRDGVKRNIQELLHTFFNCGDAYAQTGICAFAKMMRAKRGRDARSSANKVRQRHFSSPVDSFERPARKIHAASLDKPNERFVLMRVSIAGRATGGTGHRPDARRVILPLFVGHFLGPAGAVRVFVTVVSALAKSRCDGWTDDKLPGLFLAAAAPAVALKREIG